MIANNIEVVVLGITGEQVKLGILAPKNISVHRKEIYEQILEENKEAAIKHIPDAVLNSEALKDLLK